MVRRASPGVLAFFHDKDGRGGYGPRTEPSLWIRATIRRCDPYRFATRLRHHRYPLLAQDCGERRLERTNRHGAVLSGSRPGSWAVECSRRAFRHRARSNPYWRTHTFSHEGAYSVFVTNHRNSSIYPLRVADPDDTNGI